MRQFFIKFLKISFFKHKRHWFHYIYTSYLPFSPRLHHPSFIISTLVPFTLFFTVVVVALVFVCLCRYKFNLSDAEKKTFPLNVITSRSIWFHRFSVKWMKLFVHESENNDDDGGLTEVKWNWEREREALKSCLRHLLTAPLLLCVRIIFINWFLIIDWMKSKFLYLEVSRTDRWPFEK